MELVDFGDSNALLVTDDVIKQVLIDELKQRWNNYEYNTFPGPQPVSIERVHMEGLFNKPYWVCEKSDGMRFLLVCTRYLGKPYCFLVDRRLDVYMLNLEIVTDAFDGTILDGELVRNKVTHCFEYLVYDSTMVKGESTMNLPHSERIKRAVDVVQFIKHNNNTPFQIRMKAFYPIKQFREYVRDVVPTIGHEIDGYIFTPESDPVMSGTHFSLYKWKEQTKNTVDFLLERNHYKPSEYISKIAKGKTLKSLFDNKVVIDPGSNVDCHLKQFGTAIVECEYLEPDRWRAVLVRHDKTRPNSYVTWTKTLVNIYENIQLKEFYIN